MAFRPPMEPVQTICRDQPFRRPAKQQPHIFLQNAEPFETSLFAGPSHKYIAILKIVNTHLDGIFFACLCPKILKYTKYSVPAEGGMPAIVLAGKLTTPQALSAILGLQQSKNLIADLHIANSENCYNFIQK